MVIIYVAAAVLLIGGAGGIIFGSWETMLQTGPHWSDLAAHALALVMIAGAIGLFELARP